VIYEMPDNIGAPVILYAIKPVAVGKTVAATGV
jgi:hypothetical protein